MITINPNYLSWYQQIQKNAKDIEDLYGKINVVNICNIELSEDDASIPLSNTDITDTNKIGFLITKNGLLFKVVTIVDNEVYIKYICDLKGPKGEQGIQGARGPQGIQGPTGAEGPQGPAGIQGPQGIQGVQGIQGPKGDRGDNGNSFVVTGSAVSVQDLPDVSTQELGTAYYVGSSYPRPVYAVVMYEGAKVWQNQGTLQGPQGPQGPQGVQGEQGPQGATGPEGPQGPQGPAGEPGASINNMGGWIEDNEYHPLDVVTYQGSSYICDVEITGSTTPPSEDPTHWSVLAQKGDTGATGPQGPEGPQGPSGASSYLSDYYNPNELRDAISQLITEGHQILYIENLPNENSIKTYTKSSIYITLPTSTSPVNLTAYKETGTANKILTSVIKFYLVGSYNNSYTFVYFDKSRNFYIRLYVYYDDISYYENFDMTYQANELILKVSNVSVDLNDTPSRNIKFRICYI